MKSMMRKIVYCLFFSILLSSPVTVFAKKILVLGDSLSAGYGIKPEQGWVHLLQLKLNKDFPRQHQVINASISGETTSGALARLPKLLKQHQPHVVIIELGGNDALRGQPPAQIENNLSTLINLSQKTSAKVLVLGMKIPPNYGTAYSQAVEQSYVKVSQKYKTGFVPFFMKGIAGNKKLMQNDQIHPNAQAQPILLNNSYSQIKSLLK